MSSKIWWTKKYLLQLKAKYFTAKTNRDKDYVRNNYSKTGTRDVDLHFGDTPDRFSIVNGERTKCSPQVPRDFVLNKVEEQIRECNARRVLEVGAGTGINLYLLSQALPDVEFTGIDLTPERIATGKKWFKENKDFEPNISVGDVTQLKFEDNSFDLVFSGHCFEQLDQYAHQGVVEVCRVASKQVVFLEPDYKHSNAAQKLFLHNHNYLVNFADTINKVAPDRLTHRSLDTYFNPLNRTGLYIVDVDGLTPSKVT